MYISVYICFVRVCVCKSCSSRSFERGDERANYSLAFIRHSPTYNNTPYSITSRVPN